jgi:hypothetical protein
LVLVLCEVYLNKHIVDKHFQVRELVIIAGKGRFGQVTVWAYDACKLTLILYTHKGNVW